MLSCVNTNSELWKELLELNKGNIGLSKYQHDIIVDLQNNGFFTTKRGKNKSTGELQYAIPKKDYTTKDIPGQLRGDFSKVKDVKGFEELDRILTEKDIDWIKIKETSNAYWLILEPATIKELKIIKSKEKQLSLFLDPEVLEAQQESPEVANQIKEVKDSCK